MNEDASSQPGRHARRAQHTPGALTTGSHRTDDVYTIFVTGELDLATVDRVAQELKRAEATDARSIVIDMSSLTFMDSTGVQLIVGAHHRSRANGDRLCLRGAPANVRRLFAICGVDNLLPFAD